MRPSRRGKEARLEGSQKPPSLNSSTLQWPVAFREIALNPARNLVFRVPSRGPGPVRTAGARPAALRALLSRGRSVENDG